MCGPSSNGPAAGPERRSWVEFARAANRYFESQTKKYTIEPSLRGLPGAKVFDP